MINLNLPTVKLVILLLPAMFIFSGSAYAISKCQDASGKWHYGDNAALICGDAKITVINKRGRTIEEIGPPLTEEELLAQEAEEKRLELEEQQEAKREQEKKRILAIYPREESIIRARDSRLNGMDKNIKLQEDLLDGMRLNMRKLESKELPADKKDQAKLEKRKEDLQASIDEYYQSITHLRREREKTAEKYERILIEFRELTTDVTEKE